MGNVFLGTQSGASDGVLLSGLGINAVVNITAGKDRCPKYFEAYGVEYLHLELKDELATDPSHAVPRAVAALRKWCFEGKRVLVHCKAGLSRSVTTILAWLMLDSDFSLEEATDFVTERRCRNIQCAPSFWCYLALLEREKRGWPAGTRPSIDFTPRFVTAFSDMGFTDGQIKGCLQDDADWVHFALFYAALRKWGFAELAVCGMVAQRPEVEPRTVRKAVSTSLLLMEVYHQWAALQAFGLRSLSAMAGFSDEASAIVALEGAVGKTVNAMDAHMSDVEVQIAGCEILSALSLPGGPLEEMVLLGVVETVRRAMEAHPDVRKVQDLCCGVLVDLVEDARAARVMNICSMHSDKMQGTWRTGGYSSTSRRVSSFTLTAVGG